MICALKITHTLLKYPDLSAGNVQDLASLSLGAPPPLLFHVPVQVPDTAQNIAVVVNVNGNRG